MHPHYGVYIPLLMMAALPFKKAKLGYIIVYLATSYQSLCMWDCALPIWFLKYILSTYLYCLQDTCIFFTMQILLYAQYYRFWHFAGNFCVPTVPLMRPCNICKSLVT